MQRRYSQYTVEELRREISALTEKARKAEQMGMVNEYAVHQRKIVMAKSYMIDPKTYKSGQVYEIEGAPGEVFEIDYMKGVFAWGVRKNLNGEVLTEDEIEALPIALLIKKIN
ncbi:YfhH family protein [Bacillaceae bacterium W0354]